MTSQCVIVHPQRRFSLWLFGWRLILAFFKLLLGAVVCLLIGGTWLYYEYGKDLPDPREIGQHRSFETTRIYARDEQTLLYEIVDPRGGKRTVVPFDQIPRILRNATVAVEDAGFYAHPGVDARAVVRAFWLNFTHNRIMSGGSTITQQLVRVVLLPQQEPRKDEFLPQLYEHKLREAILAYRVSQEYSKDQILNLYLNEVYYGAQAYGVEAAAQTYFGKAVWQLSEGEATLLAGLPQSPTFFNPFLNFEGAKARQQITLSQMVKNGYLTPSQAEELFRQPLQLVQAQKTDILAPHFAYYVRDLLEKRYGPEMFYRGGLRVITTIDLPWQAEAQRIAQEQVAKLQKLSAHNAAVVLLSPDSQILAMVGSIDYNNPAIDGQVNVTLASRQPGSALKPIVYAAALQKGWTAGHVLWDNPTDFKRRDGTVYHPFNYDNAWHGPQRLRMALANSLNIPAVKALEFVGVNNFVALAKQMGITTFDAPDRQDLAMALGSNEVRLLELTGAYNTFRNGGKFIPPTAILKITNRRGEVLERWTPTGQQVLGANGEQIAYLITDILSDNQARRYIFGRNNVMELPNGITAAVKTGTSNDWRDSWAIGYSPDITIGAWVGNNDSSPMREVAGSNGGGQIWRELMVAYHQGRVPQPFSRPDGIVEQAICGTTGGKVSSACPYTLNEKFIIGSEPQNIDVTYKKVWVGGGGTCLAVASTPPNEAREVTFAVYPPEFYGWAVRNGIPQPPKEACHVLSPLIPKTQKGRTGP